MKNMCLRFLTLVVVLFVPVLAARGEGPATSAPTVRVVFVGDIMLDRTPGRVVKETGVDPFRHVARLLQDADVTIGNLECVVATSGEAVKKPYNFRADPKVLPFLKKYFHAVSLANNHTGDFGPGALVEMTERLTRAEIAFFGAGADRRRAHDPWIVEKNGVKVAVLGYNEFNPRSFEAGDAKPGVAWSVDEEVVADIRDARSKADVVLTFMHWGREYMFEPSHRQKTLARLMIDAGADAVIGGHPHVVETVELFRGKPIVYSLGNFVFDDFLAVEPILQESARISWIVRLTVGKAGVVALRTSVTRTDDEGFPQPANEPPAPPAGTPVKGTAAAPVPAGASR